MLYTCEEGCQGQGCVSTGSVGGSGHSIVPTMDPNSVLVSSIVHRVGSIVHRVGSIVHAIVPLVIPTVAAAIDDGPGEIVTLVVVGVMGCAGKPCGEIAI
jgi:hypothetical protein